MAWELPHKLKSLIDDEAANQYEDEPTEEAYVQPQESADEDAEDLAWRNVHERRLLKHAVISKTCVIQGNVQIGEENLTVLGRVEGNITVKGNVTISEGGSVTGNIVCKNFMLVGGELKGDLTCDEDAFIYASGQLIGNVKNAANMELGGCIDGDVHVVGLSSLAQTAHLAGNISTYRLKIEDGAFLNGKVEVASRVPECDETVSDAEKSIMLDEKTA